MARSYKNEKTRDKYSKDVLKKEKSKERQFNKNLANSYFEEDEDDAYVEEVYQYP
tara:strand:+ start:4756 stop:4920 length:165 start_codon:yes stop_codon:yes gene_type:complete